MRILSAAPGFIAPLREDEINKFLTESKLPIHISTVNGKGEPNIHPTWYYFDSTNNRFYILTYKLSKKTENLKAKNIIYFCVDDQYQSYKGVKGKGIVKIHEDIEHNIPIAEKIAITYLGSLEHPTAKEVYRRVKNGLVYFVCLVNEVHLSGLTICKIGSTRITIITSQVISRSMARDKLTEYLLFINCLS